MSEKTFFIVDVFAEEKYAGNQLAVFMNGHLYSDAEMQQIAKEMNYSEVTFYFPEESNDDSCKVRIFTPKEEIPFAGHPTLGTAYVLLQEWLQKPLPTLYLDLPVGKIPVNVEYELGKIKLLTMRQNQPEFGKILPGEEVAQALGLTPSDLDGRFPVQIVSTGLPFIIVPLKSLAAVRSIQLNMPLYRQLIAHLPAKDILVFCPETYYSGNDLNVRVFVDSLGIPEDPATGSANGCLTGYLVKYNYFNSPTFNIKVEQGFEIGRKSLLYLKGEKHQESIIIEVGGHVIPVAKGTLV
ncbi:PhzF family phenazine biosynthesis protein [Zhaonella formicivorans]|jgi:trans-2,3-dihydro-3-hydroxyanthranilate isomerase|uniref:PhzF family phenazine biosynthesis protein n=1 Tax=Zhaonella formicivorans TaxID=2528593 RepID=UPI0010D212D2|nr:PhzF family phenazine biosynthesis protein [Zhaonella formicivorans]